MKFVENDGGRADEGYRGKTGDCVVRSIAIAAELPYGEVYDAIFQDIKDWINARRKPRSWKDNQLKKASPRNGVPRPVIRKFMSDLGWTWTPTMHIGSGCTVHLKSDELPAGRLVVSVSKHITAVIDGVIHDAYDPSRDETRCVYGYWSKGQEPL